MPQGLLPLQYQADSTPMTSFAGLPLYLDLARTMDLRNLLDTNVKARNGRGYSDSQVCQAILLSQLAGGSCVEDIERLRGDSGLDIILRNIELHGLVGKERRAALSRLKDLDGEALPTASSVQRYLDTFHDFDWEAQREAAAEAGIKAFIPPASPALRGLYETNSQLVSFIQENHPSTLATLDMDATVVETTKKNALYCYKHFPAYQPLQVYWYEQKLLLHSEFRDGNVPAGYEQLRVLKESLAMLPSGVKKVFMRSDTAGYQWDILKYCAEGKNERFGVIDFAVGADVTPEFKKAVAQVKEKEWKPLMRKVRGKMKKTGQEWAEVVYVPSAIGYSKNGPEYRFVAIRELLPEQLELPGIPVAEQLELPFPTIELERGREVRRFKIYGMVTNCWEMTVPALIQWYRGRCGKSEEVHKILKEDLAGGTLPSGKFGANAAWWALTVLAFNLTVALKILVLGPVWEPMRLKGLRYHLIGLVGRVIRTGRRLIIRVCEEGYALIADARRRILELHFSGD